MLWKYVYIQSLSCLQPADIKFWYFGIGSVGGRVVEFSGLALCRIGFSF